MGLITAEQSVTGGRWNDFSRALFLLSMFYIFIEFNASYRQRNSKELCND